MVNPSRSNAWEDIDPASDHFAVLGLPRQYRVARDELEQRYLERAQAVHPDRFAHADTAVQRAIMERSAAVNESYRVLRDPVRRAEYLVKLGGIDLDSSDPAHGAPAMGTDFLVDMIERRETLEAARASGASALASLCRRIEDEAEDVFERALADIEAGRTRAAARLLVERRYLQRLLDEIEGATTR